MTPQDPDFIEKSAASLLGDLTPEEQAELAAILARDPQARAHHEELKAMNDLLDSHHTAAAPTPNFEQRMVGAFRRRATRESTGHRLSRWLRLPAIYIPVAAAMMLSLVQIGSSITGEHQTLWVTARYFEKPNATFSTWHAHGGNESRTVIIDESQSALAPASPRAMKPQPTTALSVDAMGDISAASSAPMSQTEVSNPVINNRVDSISEYRKKDAELRSDAPDSGPQQPAAAPIDARKLIRNASIDLEIRAFDSGAQAVIDLATQAGGYIATRDSSRLPNGKMSGQLVVKVPPAALDSFLRQLRGLGQVRNQSLGTEDVTKAYFDTGARLRNARKMEDSLIELLKNTKGKVSELLQVERELARVRGEIEEMQGSLKLWDSLVAYATVTVQLSEKDLDEAAAYLLRERVSLSLATTDVEKAYQQARKIADDSKAQTVQSTLTHDGDRRASGILVLLLDPASADATLERLKTLGRVLDFRREAQRVARDGGSDAPNASVERERVQVTLSISSQDETPAQRTRLRLETDAVEKQVAALRAAAAALNIEIKDSSFQQQPDGGQLASLRFALPLADYDAFFARISKSGAVKDLSVQRNDAGQPGSVAERAEIFVNVMNPPRLVPSENGFLATLRHTFTQAVGALTWSLRMIGVALAFLAPWALGLAAVVAAIRLIRRAKKRKSQ
jgi:hypothetical protein